MENENVNASISSETNLAENLQFMRLTLEKVLRQVKPKTSNSIMWGLICMTIYIGIHFLIKNELFNWIRPFQISLISVGVFCTIIQCHFLFKKFKQDGFVPQFLISLSWGLIIILLPIFIFDMLGLFKGMYCGAAFIYALSANTIVVILGILHSRLWLIGSIFIIPGILLAFIIKEYSFIILGITTGLGIILPAILVDLNYRKQERENAQV